MSKPIFTVSASVLMRAAACVSTEETRYYLCGVHIEPCPAGGVYAVCTDGHKMAVVHDPHGFTSGKFIIGWDKDHGSAITKAAKARRVGTAIVIGNEDESVTLAEQPGYGAVLKDGESLPPPVPFLTLPKALIDGTFPDFHRVVPAIPQGAKAAWGQYNGHDLVAFLKCAVDSRQAHLSIFTVDTAGPALVRGTDNDWFGVVMPRRSASAPAFPDWYAGAVPEAQAAEASDETVAE